MAARLLHRAFMPTIRPFKLFVDSQNQSRIKLSPCPLIATRTYAKSKDRGKDKKKSSLHVEINPMEMGELINVSKLRDRCSNTIEKMKDEFTKHLSIRSTTGSIDSLKVKFGGKEYELQELAQIVRKNPKTIVLNFASFPQAIPDVLKAINSSGLNLNPQQDGTTLFVPVPKVTKEHREALAKNAKIIYVKYRDILKDIHMENIKTAKKAKSEDLSRSVQSQITALCEQYQVECKTVYNTKHRELVGE